MRPPKRAHFCFKALKFLHIFKIFLTAKKRERLEKNDEFWKCLLTNTGKYVIIILENIVQFFIENAPWKKGGSGAGSPHAF